MSFEERGAYITLLCFQAAKGPLLEKDILKKVPPAIWEAICCKFETRDGRVFNVRLAEEVKKRSLYTESRRNNLHMGKHMGSHMGKHMENEDEDEDVNRNKDEVLKVWNERMPWKVREISGSRLTHLKERLKEKQFIDEFHTILTNILESDFLSGRKTSKDHPNFRADFDFLIKNETNYIKILEGKYANAREKEVAV